MALGSYSPLLLRQLGIGLPVYPVKGYSLTMPITDPAGAPESTVMDETHKVAITRLGDRIRVGGMAELDGYSTKLRAGAPRARSSMSSPTSTPTAATSPSAEFWCGLRPMTPGRPAGDRPRRATPTSASTPATARWAGPWPAAPAACSPT